MAKKRRKSLAGRSDDDADAEPGLPKPTAPVTTGLGSLLERAGLKKLPPEKPRRATDKAGPKPASAPSNRSYAPLPEQPPPPLPAPPRAPQAKPAARPKPAAPPPVLSTADLSAWNRAMGGVQPLRRIKSAQAGPTRPPAKVVVVQSPDDAAARERLDALVGGGVRFDVRWDLELVQALREGSPESLLTRAAALAFAPEAQLDLHRVRAAEAQRAVADFVRSEHRRGARRLLIIVGKGLHSEDGVGVLARAAVAALTDGVAAPLVAAVSSAHPKHGGSGALAVILR